MAKIINKKNPIRKNFANLSNGDTFLYDGVLFMKTSPDEITSEAPNATCLETGITTYIKLHYSIESCLVEIHIL